MGRSQASFAFSGAPGNSAAESASAQQGKPEQNTYAIQFQYFKHEWLILIVTKVGWATGKTSNLYTHQFAQIPSDGPWFWGNLEEKKERIKIRRRFHIDYEIQCKGAQPLHGTLSQLGLNPMKPAND